jgi:hypothetical protein
MRLSGHTHTHTHTHTTHTHTHTLSHKRLLTEARWHEECETDDYKEILDKTESLLEVLKGHPW